jgi:acyl carrier protein
MAGKSVKEIEGELVRGISAMMAKTGTKLAPDSPLADMGLDSFMLVEIFVMIEKKYGVKLLDSGIRKEDLETVGSLAAYVGGKTG